MRLALYLAVIVLVIAATLAHPLERRGMMGTSKSASSSSLTLGSSTGKKKSSVGGSGKKKSSVVSAGKKKSSVGGSSKKKGSVGGSRSSTKMGSSGGVDVPPDSCIICEKGDSRDDLVSITFSDGVNNAILVETEGQTNVDVAACGSTVEVHVSCSKPLYLGQVFDDCLTIVDFDFDGTTATDCDAPSTCVQPTCADLRTASALAITATASEVGTNPGSGAKAISGLTSYVEASAANQLCAYIGAAQATCGSQPEGGFQRETCFTDQCLTSSPPDCADAFDCNAPISVAAELYFFPTGDPYAEPEPVPGDPVDSSACYIEDESFDVNCVTSKIGESPGLSVIYYPVCQDYAFSDAAEISFELSFASSESVRQANAANWARLAADALPQYQTIQQITGDQTYNFGNTLCQCDDSDGAAYCDNLVKST